MGKKLFAEPVMDVSEIRPVGLDTTSGYLELTPGEGWDT